MLRRYASQRKACLVQCSPRTYLNSSPQLVTLEFNTCFTSVSKCYISISNLNPRNWFHRKQVTTDSSLLIEQDSSSEVPHIVHETGIEMDTYITPHRTFFDVFEDMWMSVSSLLSPIEMQIYLMSSVHTSYDLTWGFTFFLWGVLIRLVTLIPALYANRNQLRLSRIQPQIAVLNDRWNRVRNDQKVTRDERNRVKESINRQKKRLYHEHKCSQLRAGAQMITMPIMISSVMAIRSLVAYETSLETASFGWITDLTMPDPTLLLPLACMGLFFVNFELNQSLNKGSRGAIAIYLRWGIRIGSVVLFYSTYNQPAAFFCYWMGLSSIGILQPILLRWQPFRNFFQFPDVPDSVKKQNDWLTVLLNPKPTEEQVAAASKHQYKTIRDFKVVFEPDTISDRKRPKS